MMSMASHVVESTTLLEIEHHPQCSLWQKIIVQNFVLFFLHWSQGWNFRGRYLHSFESLIHMSQDGFFSIAGFVFEAATIAGLMFSTDGKRFSSGAWRKRCPGVDREFSGGRCCGRTWRKWYLGIHRGEVSLGRLLAMSGCFLRSFCVGLGGCVEIQTGVFCKAPRAKYSSTARTFLNTTLVCTKRGAAVTPSTARIRKSSPINLRRIEHWWIVGRVIMILGRYSSSRLVDAL